MSTRAKIGMMNPDGTITSINCYRDGYPQHAGNILAEHYPTEEKIKVLMEGGHLMDIGTTPEMCYYEQKAGGLEPEDCRPETYRSLGHFLNCDEGANYLYIFYQGKWCVHDANV